MFKSKGVVDVRQWENFWWIFRLHTENSPTELVRARCWYHQGHGCELCRGDALKSCTQKSLWVPSSLEYPVKSLSEVAQLSGQKRSGCSWACGGWCKENWVKNLGAKEDCMAWAVSWWKVWAWTENRKIVYLQQMGSFPMERWKETYFLKLILRWVQGYRILWFQSWLSIGPKNSNKTKIVQII